MKKNPYKDIYAEELDTSNDVPIVSDAAIATFGIGEGRLIPVLIIDTSNHRHIEDLVRAHDNLPPGDVDIRWGWPKDSEDVIFLILDFKKPCIATICLEFDIMNRGGLVDLIMNSKALYLQPGREGDRFSKTLDKPKILIEVPNIGFMSIWDDKWKKTTYKKMRNKGLSRSQARKTSQNLIDEWRETLKIRIK